MLEFKLFIVRLDMHPLGQAWLLLQQKEVEQLSSAQALPSHQEPPMEKEEEWLGCRKCQTFPLQGSHIPTPTPTAFPAKQSLMLSHVRSPGFSSLGHLASPGFKPMINKRCNAPGESLVSGLPLSPSLEILVSPNNSRITSGQVELDKAGSSLLGAA